MSYTAPAKNHHGRFCDRCGHYYGHPNNTPVTVCPPCAKRDNPGK